MHTALLAFLTRLYRLGPPLAPDAEPQNFIEEMCQQQHDLNTCSLPVTIITHNIIIDQCKPAHCEYLHLTYGTSRGKYDYMASFL